MASKSSIMAAVETRIAGIAGYAYWTVGITQDCTRRKGEHDNDGKSTGCWTHWQADSLFDAQDIERYFINKGMKGGSGGNMANNTTTYVYVF